MKRDIIFLHILSLSIILASACASHPGEPAQELLPLRPPQTNSSEELFQGITYSREFREMPRPMMVHIVTIDLTTPGVRVFVTPGNETGKTGMEVSARTTSEVLTEFGLQAAINGSFFTPFHSNGPTDFYPHAGDPVDIFGLAISDGVPYSAGEEGAGVLCILVNNQAQINDEDCPGDTTQAVAGGTILVDQGIPIIPEEISGDGLHPRTAVAIDETGKILWLIIVDGRQPGYSEGIALVELATGIQELGAYAALNLDGGGSTTLVIEGAWSPHILNAPIHTRIPMRQRPVANHVGIYANPIEP